ncbi:glycoside hydrolase family 99-like domain-containing protein [Enterocloster bolteae]|uniref:glycosyltransferase WbsX family protein n=1 Tax=Enterocloster bolteae TaxID=208479 RepID=UPI002A831920|nr:glycoside hydrolase family 99-like domain-containing protein [Enterocloster bolteae]
MKVIATYLPQFYRTPENDAWWGAGFTEWTAVKKAERLFDGHDQPRVPLNEFYYNLLDKSTMVWQANLMHEYHVFGMAFYHYWFKDGKRILEKPAENLLRWKDIDMPFCFSWANESWTRTWSNLGEKNTWSSKFEPSRDIEHTTGILLEQKYGNEKEWCDHFQYLVRFFRDERYIKIDGKPLFLIYRPASIPCLARMIEYWKKLAEDARFPGIYVVGVNIEKRGILDAVLLQEPQFSMRDFVSEKIIDGNRLWNHILNKKVSANRKTYLCGFSGYDDTPRRGEGGKTVLPVRPEDFKKYMEKLLAKSDAMGNEFTFINAWNEWGEGMYLEPDQKNKFGMLEALDQAVKNYEKESCDIVSLENVDSLADRYHSYWHILDLWLRLIENGGSLSGNLEKRGYKNIALYGIGMLGLHVVRQLENSQVKIVYGIDQRGEKDVNQGFPVYKKEDMLPDVDAVIVSATYDFGSIYDYLKEKVKCPVISLEEIVEENA